MAKPSTKLVTVLRSTVHQLKESPEYQWGHMGSCNCGFLAREITKLSKAEIHAKAMAGYGDWNDQLNDYCPASGMPMDEVITQMLAYGLDTDDLKHLERLSSPAILRSLPKDQRSLRHNVKADVIIYLEAWIQLLEQELLLFDIYETRLLLNADDLKEGEKKYNLLVDCPD